MQRCVLFFVIQVALISQAAAQPVYDRIENYLAVPSTFANKKILLGQVSGLAIDRDDNLYVYHRADRVWNLEMRDRIQYPVVLVFDNRGALVHVNDFESALPHMIDVDAKGNLWTVDVARQEVITIWTKGIVRRVGEAFVPGNDPEHFNLPTDVSVLQDGSFYVSDGYRNSRIIKFSKDGQYLFEWGKKGTGEGEFNIPHSVKYSNGKVFVADRENSRLQVFDAKGKFLSKYDVGEKIGRLFAVTVDSKGNIYLSGMKEEGGGTLILSPDMKILAELDTGGHDVAVDSKGNVYVTNGNNVTKFIPK